MFQNYLRISLRNIKQQKGYSFITIFGLAFGMACAIQIFLYNLDELAYDQFHENASQIYRVTYRMNVTGRHIHYPITPTPLAQALRDEFPEIVNTVRMFPNREKIVVQYGDKRFFEEKLIYTDETFFNVFSFSLMKGDYKTVLRDPFSLVITEEMAVKYFGDEDPIGNYLTVNTGFLDQDYLVTGVVRNVPRHSHFRYDFLTPFSSMNERWQELLLQWTTYVAYTYIQLQENVSPVELEKKLPSFLEKYVKDETAPQAFLQPLTSIHLHSQLYPELDSNGNIVFVYILMSIACFILLIACINYMNLATARFAKRAREVGMRKVFGAARRQLIRQFLFESIFLTIFAFMLALLLIELLRPAFNNLVGRELAGSYARNIKVMIGFVCIVLFTGITAGSYPALYLSAFRPSEILKGKLSTGKKSSILRKFLVVFQFSVSTVLIIGTFIVFNQLNYMKSKQLGFDKEHVVVIPNLGGGMQLDYESVKSELTKNTNILSACATLRVPGRGFGSRAVRPEGAAENESIHMSGHWVDHDFVETYGLKILEGRNFSKAYQTDATEAFILNEAAVKKFGWGSAVGKHLVLGERKQGTVIGVVQDFHFQSLHQTIAPLIIHIQPGRYFYVSVRIRPNNIDGTLDFIRNQWHKFDPNHPFDYFFLDDYFDRQYKSEERLEKILRSFAFLAIFIASLGLFGLVSFITEQKTKEIGIRKVLGASSFRIVSLLSKDFIRLILLGNLIAWPIAYVAMNRWLQNFAYRAKLTWGIFIMSAVIALGIGLVTMSVQSVKAALTNPVDSLKHE